MSQEEVLKCLMNKGGKAMLCEIKCVVGKSHGAVCTSIRKLIKGGEVKFKKYGRKRIYVLNG